MGPPDRKDGAGVPRDLAAVRFLLPLLLENTLWIDTGARGRSALEKHLGPAPASEPTWWTAATPTRGREGGVGLSYRTTRRLSLVGRWHSDCGWGGGLSSRF